MKGSKRQRKKVAKREALQPPKPKPIKRYVPSVINMMHYYKEG